ncbi:hypothetical protein [Asticcacaulis solisilvae]|uniref:hypothetical protein n=1 Tax=Asticcacaulis solisilvae TaxID=1217274 RepID=UPI003FD8E368
MKRWATLAFVLAIAAGPVTAQTTPATEPAAPPAADDAPPRLYQADKAIAVKAPTGETRSVQTDPLSSVRKIGVTLSFDCSEATCSDSSYELAVKGADGQSVVFDVTGQGGKLIGRVARSDGAGNQALVGTPKPGETYDLRISWSNGNRVTFDLYRHDGSGRDLMESHDVQLSAPVDTLSMRVTSGELQISRQVYTFR